MAYGYSHIDLKKKQGSGNTSRRLYRKTWQCGCWDRVFVWLLLYLVWYNVKFKWTNSILVFSRSLNTMVFPKVLRIHKLHGQVVMFHMNKANIHMVKIYIFIEFQEKNKRLNNWLQIVECHAAKNAIDLRSFLSLEECTIYITQFPCNECVKSIIQCGIKHIVYGNSEEVPAMRSSSLTMLENGKVTHSYVYWVIKSFRILISF